MVAKFYRPGRWSDAQIDEEHAFARELAEREIPVVAPHTRGDIRRLPLRRLSAPRRAHPGARRPEALEWIGRFLGRIHAVGATKKFIHRDSARPRRPSATTRAPTC